MRSTYLSISLAMLISLAMGSEGVATTRCESRATLALHMPEHSGGLNKCGCHFNRKTGECHCHQTRGCGCECQPASCK